MRKSLFLLLTVLIVGLHTANASVERSLTSLTGQNIVNAAGGTQPDLSLSDQWLSFMNANNNTSLSGYWGNTFGVKTGSGAQTGMRVVLRFNDQLRKQYNQYWKVRVTYTITVDKQAPTLASGISYTGKTLEVEYNPLAPYSDIAMEQYPDYLTASMNVTQVEFLDANNTPIPSNTLSFPADIYLDLEQLTERYYVLNPATAPQIQLASGFNATTPVNNELHLSWSFVQGAESYDLEWLFVDDYLRNTNQQWIQTNNTTIPIDWRNATRVNLRGHSYKIPLGYPAGLIIYRVRAVGVDHINFATRIEGAWSHNLPPGSSVNLATIYSYVYEWSGLDRSINWQYSAAYAEEGLHKEVISYYDGALYNRQTVTVLNTQQDAMVAETKYDYSGRPGAALLPAPVTSSGIHYYTNFNTNYSRTNFDTDAKLLNPDPVPTTNGSGQFWSPANPNLNGSNAYLPDAEGYPYARTVYLNDGTSRPSIVGNVGAAHRIGAGHETKFYYGTPASQDELDRLFGNEAGLVSYYKKNMIQDPNGQVSVSYIDAYGRVRATSLAGAVPDNLLAIDGKPATPFQVQGASLLGNNYLNANNEQVSVTTLTVSSIGNYNFSYSLTGAQHCDGCLDPAVSPGGCVDCKYDLDISILNQDGSLYYQHPVQTNVSATGPLNFTINFTQVGVFQVVKVLKPNAAYQAFLMQQYLDEQDCFVPEPETVNCPTCEEACEEVYKRTASDNSVYYVDDNGNTVSDADGLLLIAQCKQASCGAQLPDLCALRWEAMKRDVSPGGQYFDNMPDVFIINGSGQQVPNTAYDKNLWLTTMVSYSGSPFSFSLLGAGISNWTDVRNNWNAAWADILVEYHPERCAYSYFCETGCGEVGSPGYVTWQTIRDYEVALLNSVNGEYPGQTPNPVLINPTGISSGTTAAGQLADNSQYYNGTYTNTSYQDPVFGADGCYHNTGINEALKYFININNNCPSGTPPGSGVFYNIWYVLDDPDNIHGNPNPSLDPSIVAYFRTLHGDPTTSAPGLIGTGPGQMTKFQYFRSVYMFYRNLSLYKHYDDYMSAASCASWTGSHASAIGPQYTNYFIQLDLVSNSNSSLPLNGPVDDYGFVVHFPPIVTFDALGTGNTLPIPCTMQSTFTQLVNGNSGNNGAFALQCREACEGAADEWMQQLSNCLNATQQAQCRQNLIDICTLYCDADHPQGSDGNNSGTAFVLAPDGVTQLSSFEEVITYYNNVNGSMPDCPWVYHGRDYEQTLCTCDNINAFLTTRGYDVNNVSQWSIIAADFNALFTPTASYTIAQIQAWASACAQATPPASAFSNLQAPVLCPATDPNTGISDFYSAILAECNTDLQFEANMNAWFTYSQQVQAAALNYMQAVQATCMGSVGTRESFTVDYPLDEYYYTLYYYDQAGNLVKTVPPEGVRTLGYSSYTHTNLHGINTPVTPTLADVKNHRQNPTTAAFVHPPHQMVTRYTFNSLNNPVAVLHPDHGTPGAMDGVTTMWYDGLGRVVVTQDSRQRGYATPAYSYMSYDALGRMYESGQLTTSAAFSAATAFDANLLNAWMSTGVKDQVTKIYFDQVMPGLNTDVSAVLTQKQLRNRVSSVTWDENPAVAGLDHATHYSYDIHGNVTQLVQEIPALSPLGQNVKLIAYEYDLVSGNIQALHYQTGQADQFHHRYTYDADNRLVNTRTSRDGVIWNLDSKNLYYRHGPVARIELGEKQVQATDYVYTIHGLIKGMNSNVLSPTLDQGQDGVTGNRIHRNFARDVASFSLEYYNGDYKAAESSVNTPAANWNTVVWGSGPYATALKGLYNENVAGMQTNVALSQSTTTSGLQAMAYRYDQLNRIKSTNAFRDGTLSASNNVWGTTAANNGAYAETFSYDLNGNIMSLTRNGNLSGAQQVMDQFTYTYIRNTAGSVITNKLGFVDDAAASSNYTDDLDDQAAGNYTYDAVGNLVSDVKEEIQVINWNQRGKIKEVKRSAGSQKAELVFGYSADGQRLYKKVKPRTGGNLDQEEKWETLWYVRDDGGNVLAIYKQYDLLTGPNAFQRTLRLEEQTLFGEKRLGEYNANSITATVNFVNTGGYTSSNEFSSINYTTRNVVAGTGTIINRLLGHRVYELNNHLGNVLATVTDRRVGIDSNADDWVDYYSAVLNAGVDYFVFGSSMPGRTFTGTGYRYGFNGKENDPESTGAGEGLQDYGFRIYNPSLAKFLSVDPLAPIYPELTPYQFASNTPVYAIDLDGLEQCPAVRPAPGRPANGAAYYPNGLYNGIIQYGRNAGRPFLEQPRANRAVLLSEAENARRTSEFIQNSQMQSLRYVRNPQYFNPRYITQSNGRRRVETPEEIRARTINDIHRPEIEDWDVMSQQNNWQGNSPISSPARRTWRESEIFVTREYARNSEEQISFLRGQRVPTGTKGSTRPDNWIESSRTAIEVKNYNLTTPQGVYRLQNVIVSQANYRAVNLPEGSRQIFYIDISGQNVTPQQQTSIINNINSRTVTPVQVIFIK